MNHTDALNYKDAKFKIGDEEWTVKYRPFLTKDSHWVKAGRYPEKKEVYLSLYDQQHKPYSKEKLIETFQKTIMPLVIEWAKQNYTKENAEEALKKLQDLSKE